MIYLMSYSTYCAFILTVVLNSNSRPEMKEPQSSHTPKDHPHPQMTDHSNIPDASASLFLEELDDNSPVLLKHSASKSIFLSKISLLFIIYYALLFTVAVFVYADPKGARLLYRKLFLHAITWEIVALTLLFKIIISCFGNRFSRYAKLCFILDCLLSMVATLGIYFELDNFVKVAYVYNGHYLFIFLANMLLSSVVFFLTTLYHNGPKTYNVALGTLCMSLANWGLTHSIYVTWTEIMIQRTKMIIVFLIMVAYNFYIARNSYVIVNHRTESFYDHEYIRCYYSYSTDWFSFFWFGDRDEESDVQPKSEGHQADAKLENHALETIENP